MFFKEILMDFVKMELFVEKTTSYNNNKITIKNGI